MNKILGTIGLCRRAGKLVTGFDAVCEEISRPKGKAAGILLAGDISPKTEKEVRFFAEKSKKLVIKLPIGLDEIAEVLGRKTGVLAVLDEGLFKTLEKLSNEQIRL